MEPSKRRLVRRARGLDLEVGVAKAAVLLAKKFGYDEKKAELAAILHDCAKGLEEKAPVKHLKKYKVKADAAALSIPQMIHSLLGPHVAKDIFKIRDKEILEAIRWHTTGRAGMSSLEKIIYIADFIEESREYSQAVKARKLLKKKGITLDMLVHRVVSEKLKYLRQKDFVIHDDSIRLLDEMKGRTKKQK